MSLASAGSSSSERVVLVDALRGFALFGILLVNAPFLALSNNGFDPRFTPHAVDRVAEYAVQALAMGKFYLLFSFLFGYSLTLATRREGLAGRRRYQRRLVGLAVLGLAHALLFFVGDILLSYAILGVGLLAFWRRGDRTVQWAAAVSFGIGVLLQILMVAGTWADPASWTNSLVADPARTDAAFSGSFADAVHARADALPDVLALLVSLNWAPVFAMFLLGLLAGRRGVLAQPDAHPRLWRRLLIVGATVGLPAGLIAAALTSNADPRLSTLGFALAYGTGPLLVGGYVALIVRHHRSRVLRAFLPAGRMSLTGYLGESILMSAIFCGWGLGLFGRLTFAEATLVAVAVFVVLDVAAKLWLARYAQGPFEWLLRIWSHGALRRTGDLGREQTAVN